MFDFVISKFGLCISQKWFEFETDSIHRIQIKHLLHRLETVMIRVFTERNAKETERFEWQTQTVYAEIE